MYDKMNCCGNSASNDFSFKDREGNPFTHKYCSSCRSHQYGDSLINAKDWFNWVEYGADGEGYEEFSNRPPHSILT